ncbi:extracellular solute-binding protein [Roseivivax sp. CAU 1761]
MPAQTRRTLLAGLAALGAAGGLPAAAADRRPRGAPSAASPLRVLMPEGSEANLRPVVRSFEAAHGIRAELHSVPTEEINTAILLEAVAPRLRFDVALPATYGIPDLAEAGAILPLDSHAARHEPAEFTRSMLYRNGDRFDGRLYGYQTDGDVYLAFYNRDMMEDRDLAARYADRFGEALAPPRDWTAFDRQMAFFHAPEAGRYGGAMVRSPNYLGWEWWLRFHAKGIWPFGPDMAPQIAGAEGRAALEEMIASEAHQAGAISALGANWRRYDRGDVYANLGWGGTQKYLRGPDGRMRDRVVVAATPGGSWDGRHHPVSYFNWGWSYVVARHCRDPDRAYRFCLHAASARVSTLAVRQAGGFFDPFRREHYHDARIREVYSPAFLEVHRNGLQQAMPDLYLARRNDYFATLGRWLRLALDGEVTPGRALARIAESWDLLTHRTGRARQAERWRALRARYPDDLRSSLRDTTGAAARGIATDFNEESKQ